MGTSVQLCTTSFGDPVKLINFGPGILFVGDDLPVTNANGFPVAPAGATFNVFNSILDLKDYTGEVWAYASGGACTVAILENTAG